MGMWQTDNAVKDAAVFSAFRLADTLTNLAKNQTFTGNLQQCRESNLLNEERVSIIRLKDIIGSVEETGYAYFGGRR